MEIALVKAFGWSLRDIDDTDIESLLPFIFRTTSDQDTTGEKRIYCDEANFL